MRKTLPKSCISCAHPVVARGIGNKRMAKLDKFFSEEAIAQVTVTVEKDWQTVELTVRDGGFVARAEKSADNMPFATRSLLSAAAR